MASWPHGLLPHPGAFGQDGRYRDVHVWFRHDHGCTQRLGFQCRAMGQGVMDVARKASLPSAGWRKIYWTTSLMIPVSANIQAGGLRLGFFQVQI